MVRRVEPQADLADVMPSSGDSLRCIGRAISSRFFGVNATWRAERVSTSAGQRAAAVDTAPRASWAE